MNRTKSVLARTLCAATAVLVALAASARSELPARAADDDAWLTARRFALRLKAPHVPGELVVKTRDTASKRAERTLAAAGLTIAERNASVPTLLRVTGGDDAAAARAATLLAEDPDVEYVEPNYLFFTETTPNDPLYSQQWGLKQSSGVDIGAEAAWARTTGSDDVVVGVIDSGMDIRHKDLKDNLFVNAREVPGNGVDDDHNGYVDDVNGWDAVTDTGVIKDEDDHGTHVSGTIGARGNNGEGVVGVAWRVKLLPLRFITVHSGSTFDAIQCIDYATRLRQSGVNLRVLNNSWGGSGYVQSLADAIRRANAAGILFVCAAGNESTDTDALPNYPSAYEIPNVVAVGALSRGNFAAGFSNYGKRSVDLFAPGEDIESTLPGDSYGSLSGTSQATPHVSGIAALVVSAKPDATVAEMKARILGSAIAERFASNLCLAGGRVSAANALKLDAAPPAPLADFRLVSVTRSTIVVGWTAVGDDGTSGRATYYDIRWSTGPLTASSFQDGVQLDDTRVPLVAGETETAVLRGCFTENTPVYLSMRVYDKGGNFSQSETLVATPSGALTTYELAPAPSDGFSLGDPIGLHADDAAKAVDLPFDFPFYGATYRTAFVSTNGLITFDAPVTAPGGSRSDLSSLTGIAALWFDLTTDGTLSPNQDVYLDATATSATFRWIAEPYYSPNAAPVDLVPVTFAVTLHADGRVDLVYGPGNNRGLEVGGIRPLVGVSDGGCSASLVDGYSGQASLASAPAVSLVPGPASDDRPAISAPTTPTLREGLSGSFTVTATAPATLAAVLPRNATFDPATGTARFTPDSTQSGPVQFVFVATGPGGATSSKTVVANVIDDGNLPEVKFIQFKKKVTFNGVGFRVGARVQVDGADVGDAKSVKKAPATKITSANARAALSSAGLHSVVVVNPDGTRSGPFYYVR